MTGTAKETQAEHQLWPWLSSVWLSIYLCDLQFPLIQILNQYLLNIGLWFE